MDVDESIRERIGELEHKKDEPSRLLLITLREDLRKSPPRHHKPAESYLKEGEMLLLLPQIRRDRPPRPY